MLESLEAPLSLLLLPLVHLQDPLEPCQCRLGLLFLEALGAVVLILYSNLLIICRGLAIISVLLLGGGGSEGVWLCVYSY